MNNGRIYDIVLTVLKKESRGNIIKPDRFTYLLQQCHLEYYNQQYEKYAGSQLLLDSLRPFLALKEVITFASILADSGTTSSTTTDKLVESGQDFLTTVEIGMVVNNTTDSTSALVMAVDSDTILSLDADIMTSGETYTIYTSDAQEDISDLNYTYKHAISARVMSGNAKIEIVTPLEENEWANDALMKATADYPLMSFDNTKLYILPTTVTAVRLSYLIDLDDADSSLADSGTTTATTTDKLVESGQNFLTTVKVGMKVNNTTDSTSALVTAVDSNTTLSLDTDIMETTEKYAIYQPDTATDFYEPFFDYYADANANIQYLTNGQNYTLQTSEVYRDGTASGIVTGISHELKWKNQDLVNIITLLLKKLSISIQAPELSQLMMQEQQQQNVM